MAQEQKSGAAAAQKAPPDSGAQPPALSGAAVDVPSKPDAATPPALPSSSSSNAPPASDGPRSLSDSLALVVSEPSAPNLGSSIATVNHRLPPPLPNMGAQAAAAKPEV